jgi:hypothetical protein
MSFDISVGVRWGDVALLTRLEQVLDRRRRDIDTILAQYHVPRSGSRAEFAP